ncbi:hypothetical protein [Vibrio cortegadensis]|uniref:hypothetical protein n=1 Tax=Vibrio cortegadensis TaxID=1328770 RepID=UPI0021C28DCA|nr:hypothetical protein [Vibrio cortegadensis]
MSFKHRTTASRTAKRFASSFKFSSSSNDDKQAQEVLPANTELERTAAGAASPSSLR